MGIPNTLIKTCTCAGAHTHTYEHTLKEGDTYKQYGKREVDGIYALTHVHASVLAWNGTAGSVRIEKHERLRQQYRICPVTSQEHVHSAVRAYMLGVVRLISSLRFSSFTLRPRRFIYRDIYSWKDEREARTLDKATNFMSELLFCSLRLRKLGLKTNDAHNFYLS